MPPLSRHDSGFIAHNVGAALGGGLLRLKSGFVRADRGLLHRWIKYTIKTTAFEFVVAAVIITNLVCIILEADISAACAGLADSEQKRCHRAWLKTAGMIFQAIYSLEALLRIYVHRCSAFADKWFLFDLLILSFGCFDLAAEMWYNNSFPGVRMLRIVRVGRLLRGVRLLRKIPELHSMIAGFMSAMHAMAWGALLILLLLMLFAILAVEFLNPISQEIFSEGDWCHEAFTSVSMATLYFFQTLLGGDGWGVCAVPMVRSHPLSFLIFSLALVCIQLGFTNLVLAVIVEKATMISHEIQQADLNQVKQEIETAKLVAQTAIHELCKQIDTDADGVVTCDELVNGFRDCEEVQNAFMLLDIGHEDISDLFHLMDADDSGDLTYDEVTRCIHKADTQDVKRQMMFMKLQMKKTDAKINRLLHNEIHHGPTTQNGPSKLFNDKTEPQAALGDGHNSRHDQSADQLCSNVQHIMHNQVNQLQQRMDDGISMLLRHIETMYFGREGRSTNGPNIMKPDGHWVQPDASWGVPSDCFEVRSSVGDHMSASRRTASKAKEKTRPVQNLGSVV